MSANSTNDPYDQHYGQNPSHQQTPHGNTPPNKNQQDFDRLCKDIGSGVTQVSEMLAKGLAEAGNALGGVIDQAVEGYRINQQEAQMKAELARQEALVNARFGKSSSLKTSGIVRCVFGGFLTLGFGSGLLETLFTLGIGSFTSNLVGLVIMAVFFGLSIKLLVGGISRIKSAKSLEAVRRVAGVRQAVPISEIAHMNGIKPEDALSNIQHLLREGQLPQGHLDEENTTLMLTDEAYRNYLRFRESERAKALEEESRKRAQSALEHTVGKKPGELSPAAQEFLKAGNSYLDQIRQLDVDIDDEAVSAKIVQIEDVVGRILARAQEEPAVIDQLGRLMDYYLPTTVKLLAAYDALEEQGVTGSNIESSRKEIESTLDILLQAYSKLLDATFADLSLDVSSEISVLNVVLAQEGLTEDPFAGDAGEGNR